MLKQAHPGAVPDTFTGPAALGGLCVETAGTASVDGKNGPAAFGRLCVETFVCEAAEKLRYVQPPSGGCVLKRDLVGAHYHIHTSRLRAAVC